MKWRLALIPVFALLCALAPNRARADERILSYDSELAVQADGSLMVTENITVRAEGNNIRRGIYRDFPTTYKDRFGNRVHVDFEVLGVERDGRQEPWFTERKSNGVRINTGNDNFLPTPGTFTFSIHYRTNRQLGFFPDHDELYWNVTGLGWSFPIDSAQATVTLPAPVASADLKLDAYTGPDGAKGKDFQATSPQPGTAVFRSTRGFGPNEGLTIVVGFPKGLIAEPTSAQRWGWFLRDNRGVLVALAGLLLLAGFYAWRWMLVGRDPHAGPIFPRYEPPQAFGPGELRAMQRMGMDNLCFTADVVDMAVRGFLQIHEDSKKQWRLVREPTGQLDALTLSERALALPLFAEGPEIELQNTNAARVRSAISAQSSAIGSRLMPRYFIRNGYSVLAGVAFSLVVGLIAFAMSGGNGIPLLIVIGVVGVALHIVAGFLLKAPTKEGRALMDEIAGLKMYMNVAERDELRSLTGPGDAVAPPHLDAKRYEGLLPYAMALGVEAAWTKQFVMAVGAATAQQSQPSWYYGSGTGPQMGLASLGSSLGSALNSQISASATPPGSSSGGGGGGSSGGGGGGGGGGGR